MKHICSYCGNFAMACWRCTREILVTPLLSEDSRSSRKPIRDRVRSVLKLAEFLCVSLEEYMMWRSTMTPDSDTHDPSKYELLHILATAQCMDCCQCRCHVKAGSFDLLFFFFVTTGRQDSLGGSAKTFDVCKLLSCELQLWGVDDRGMSGRKLQHQWLYQQNYRVIEGSLSNKTK